MAPVPHEVGSSAALRGALSGASPDGLQNPAESGSESPRKLHDVADRSGLSAAALRGVPLPTKRREALRWVELYPDCTARELERRSGLRKINARLSELERQGVVVAAGVRTCSVTGEAATMWRATGNAPHPLVRPLTSRERIQQLEALAEKLEAENARLRAELSRKLGDMPVWGHQ